MSLCSYCRKRRPSYTTAKLEIEFKVLENEFTVLEYNLARMDLPHLLTVWQPEIISSKLYIQLENTGEEQKNGKKKTTNTKTTRDNRKVQHRGVPDTPESLGSSEGEGTYLSNMRRRIRGLLEDTTATGGEDRQGGSEEQESEIN